MTATPKPDLSVVPNGDLLALLAEAPTMALPADHPYWEVPDSLRPGIHYDRDLGRFTARGEVARVLRGEHGWTIHLTFDPDECEGNDPDLVYTVRPPQRPRVIKVPAREVAKRLIDGERVVLGDGEEVTEWTFNNRQGLLLNGNGGGAWHITVPVIEDES